MHLIFDFDGTLIDSFPCVLAKFNLLADKFNFKKVTNDEIDYLKNLSSKQLIRYLNIPLYKIPTILLEARKALRIDIPTLSSFIGLPETLITLSNAGYTLGILTSNSKENVMTWLEKQNLQTLFQFIHIESQFFGKKRALKKILKKYNIPKTNAFYIGDETRDIEAAKQNAIFSVAVTWGFNSEHILKQWHPDHIAHTPEDLLAIFGAIHLST